jgi:hypothetical protein
MLRLALVVVLLSGCVTGNFIARKNSTAHVEPAERERAFSRALAAIQRGGWIMAVSDRAGGLLTTQTMNTGAKPCGSRTCDSRSTLQVTIAESGDVTVNLHRELFAPGFGGPGHWFIPSLEADVVTIEQEQDRLLAEIVSR